jgi:hypothetical protein
VPIPQVITTLRRQIDRTHVLPLHSERESTNHANGGFPDSIVTFSDFPIIPGSGILNVTHWMKVRIMLPAVLPSNTECINCEGIQGGNVQKASGGLAVIHPQDWFEDDFVNTTPLRRW